MKLYALIFLIILLAGCHRDSRVNVGRYQSVKFNKPELYWLYYTRGITGAVVGDELNLYADSTFMYTTCGNITSGCWFTRNDSLVLVQKNNQWRNDSLRKFRVPPPVCKEPYGFRIANNTLEAIWKHDQGKMSIIKLKCIKQ